MTNVFAENSLFNARDLVIGTGGKFNLTEGKGRLWGVRLA
jgi:hypothetical protein